ncbi:hypothetical protein CEUSTIGMA_g9668.t1 [Chlamydomonas eustigma]|uniref:Uncharacterized protein n=1 Tax=Chlamydomonas eustigma TaxID=1157962 RepID=A0A250XHG1_9CHLO|nr:hypothetical protein CEUSTIGMA_g9668.t1 [Chlamydomonas eustigma]|eukprot:GAX82240.1 hypothetical protein CEUSTIGMA_g9668.t1 [Chlamydomonas eustigma]
MVGRCMSIFMYTLLTAVFALFFTLVSYIAWHIRGQSAKGDYERKKKWQNFLDKMEVTKTGLDAMSRTPDLSNACFQAGLRTAEFQLSAAPLLEDPASQVLCGKQGLAQGLLYTTLMQEQEGWGKRTQAVARSRIFDDEVQYMLASMAKDWPEAERLQVVTLGCGMDTRPWRLRRGASSRGHSPFKLIWYEVDKASIIELKAKRLQEAGICDGLLAGRVVTLQEKTKVNPVPTQRSTHRTHPASEQLLRRPPSLVVDEYYSLDCDLRHEGALRVCLQDAGFSSSHPTLWILEGDFLPKLDTASASALLKQCSGCSPMGSCLLATTVSSGCKTLALQTGFQHSLEDWQIPGTLSSVSGWDHTAMLGEITQLTRTRYKNECYPYFGRFSDSQELAKLTDVEYIVTTRRI